MAQVPAGGTQVVDAELAGQLRQVVGGLLSHRGWKGAHGPRDGAQVGVGQVAVALLLVGRVEVVPACSGDADPFGGFCGGQAQRAAQPGLRRGRGVQHLPVACGVEIGQHRGERRLGRIHDQPQTRQPRRPLLRRSRPIGSCPRSLLRQGADVADDAGHGGGHCGTGEHDGRPPRHIDDRVLPGHLVSDAVSVRQSSLCSLLKPGFEHTARTTTDNPGAEERAPPVQTPRSGSGGDQPVATMTRVPGSSWPAKPAPSAPDLVVAGLPLRLHQAGQVQARLDHEVDPVAHRAVVLDVGDPARLVCLGVRSSVEVRAHGGEPSDTGVVAKGPADGVGHRQGGGPAWHEHPGDLGQNAICVGSEGERSVRAGDDLEHIVAEWEGTGMGLAPQGPREPLASSSRDCAGACDGRGPAPPPERPSAASQREPDAAPHPSSSTRRPATGPSRPSSDSSQPSGPQTHRDVAQEPLVLGQVGVRLRVPPAPTGVDAGQSVDGASADAFRACATLN